MWNFLCAFIFKAAWKYYFRKQSVLKKKHDGVAREHDDVNLVNVSKVRFAYVCYLYPEYGHGSSYTFASYVQQWWVTGQDEHFPICTNYTVSKFNKILNLNFECINLLNIEIYKSTEILETCFEENSKFKIFYIHFNNSIIESLNLDINIFNSFYVFYFVDLNKIRKMKVVWKKSWWVAQMEHILTNCPRSCRTREGMDAFWVERFRELDFIFGSAHTFEFHDKRHVAHGNLVLRAQNSRSI